MAAATYGDACVMMAGWTSGLHIGLQEVASFAMVTFGCLVIRNFQHAPINVRSRLDLQQSHSTHDVPTPRLGGMAIFLSVVLTTAFFEGYFGGRYAQLIISAVPLIMVAMWEDAVRQTSAPVRLAATVVSALLAIGALQSWLPRLDIAALDPWMAGGFGIFMTVLYIAATVNAFNMVDGLNGLCAGIAFFALIAFNIIAAQAGFGFMTHTTMVLAAAVAAFLLFNFPFARVFLGDTGAYVLGFILAWFSVSLTRRFPEVSPWALFMVLAYPLSELCFTFIRRVAAGVSPFAPDQGHFHHLVLMNVQVSGWCPRGSRLCNPMATLFILPLAVAPMLYAIVYFDDPAGLMTGVIVYAVLFVTAYRALAARLKTAVQAMGGTGTPL